MKFICGCMRLVGEDRHDVFDDEGFIVCALHLVRRYGWRSAMFGPRSYPGLTNLQVEKLELFGIEPLVHGGFDIKPSTLPDLRDNRDPELVFHEQTMQPYDGMAKMNEMQRGELIQIDPTQGQRLMEYQRRIAVTPLPAMVSDPGYELPDAGRNSRKW